MPWIAVRFACLGKDLSDGQGSLFLREAAKQFKAQSLTYYVSRIPFSLKP